MMKKMEELKFIETDCKLLEPFRKKIEKRLKSDEEEIRFHLAKVQKNFRCELRDDEAKPINGNHLADYNPGNHDLRHQQIKNYEKRLWKIKMALLRLELGSYGICKHCHMPIPLSRLEKIPYTDAHPACKGAGHNGRK